MTDKKYTDSKVEKLVKKLGKRGWLSHKIRQGAARKLGKTGHPAAVQPLISALNDDDIMVRVYSARSLGRIGHSDVIQPLTVLLNDKHVMIRGEASWALGETGNSIAVQPLLKALKDKDLAVRNRAAGALGKINSPDAIQPLINTLEDNSESVRRSAAEALGKTNCSESVAALIFALNNSDPVLRSRICWILGTIGNPEAVKPLISTLEDGDRNVRNDAVTALGKIGAQEALQPLISVLKDQSSYVRCNAAEALGNIGDPMAAKPLVFSLEDKFGTVRWAAAEALGKIGDPIALKPFLKMLKHERDRWGLVRDEVFNFSIKLAGIINEIIIANRPFQKYYPHLYCRKCLMRTKQIRTGLAIMYTNYICFFTSPILKIPAMFVRYSKNIVTCRCCGSGLHFMKNIKQVVGLIGGDIEDISLNEDKLYVSLWSESQKKARNADIDVLEIRNTQGISYDYAINALLITLKNDVSRPAEYVKQIPVVIHKNTRIPEGAKLILDHEFGKIKWVKPDVHSSFFDRQKS